MRYFPQFLSIPYSFKLIVLLINIFFIFGNCVQMGHRKVLESPSPTYTEFSYYSNGQKEYAAQYLNGKLDGMSRYWSEDGLLISESEYSHGKPHGLWEKYYANQKTMYQVHYFHGQKHGKEKWYYENGQIKSEQLFQYGVSANPPIRWKSDGSIIY
mgnify:CR=1 FL=1